MSPKEKHISDAYNSEQKKLKGFIRKQVNTNEDAEDIVQDVFMSLTDGFDDLLNLTGVISWLYAVAKNKIIDFKRKKKTSLYNDHKNNTIEDDEKLNLGDLLSSFESLPDDTMMNDLLWEKIQQSLDLLPVNQKEVFVLHELEGYSYQQISELTDVSVNTLLSRKRYAVLFLREQLKELFEIINQ